MKKLLRKLRHRRNKQGQTKQTQTKAQRRTKMDTSLDTISELDTTEHLDDANLDEFMSLIHRLEKDDLPPKRILLRHHVQRPRHVPQLPGALVTLLYSPPTAEASAEAEIDDIEEAAKEGGHRPWTENEEPQ